MRIGIYTPYRKTLGGGEQYLFTIASCLLPNHSVTFYSENEAIVNKAEERFGLSLAGLNIEPPVFEIGNFLDKFKATKKLDVLFYCSDGSIPFSFAKKTFLLFQFPTPWVSSSLMQKIKIKKNTVGLVYSHFVEKYVQKTFGIKTIVFPPAIDLSLYTTRKKEKLILTVGRFTKGMNQKRQDVLIDSFIQLIESGLKGWEFALAGGMLPEDEDFLETLKRKTEGYPIVFLPNISRSELLSLYARASIYWHAAGYGVDVKKTPQFVEHFGITTLEAMASGAIPFVYPEGGQKEMVQNGQNGYTWKTIEELITQTNKFLTSTQEREFIKDKGKQYVKNYDRVKFKERLLKIII